MVAAAGSVDAGFCGYVDDGAVDGEVEGQRRVCAVVKRELCGSQVDGAFLFRVVSLCLFGLPNVNCQMKGRKGENERETA